MTQKHRFKVDKLIRDKLPHHLRQLGIEAFEQVMDDQEYVGKLKQKLMEEAEEVMNAASPKEIQEELADLLEVIRALASLNKISFDEVIQTADQKKEEKEGFEERLYSPFMEIASNNPNIDYYKSKPHHYPEIT